MTLYIENSGIVPEEDIVFCDGNGLPVFIFTEENIEKRICFEGKNAVGETVIAIQGKPSLIPKLTVMFGGSPFCTVSSKFSFFAHEIKIESPAADFTVIGDCAGFDYAVYKDKKPFGKVEKKWFDAGINICMTSKKDEDTALLAAIVVAADECVKRNSD
ncbi:MAG: hypothetical protein VB118_11335 [Oscillospiraceae bacterium]|nr:hypothetical protein [Oscillospiraceae bacterium]